MERLLKFVYVLALLHWLTNVIFVNENTNSATLIVSIIIVAILAIAFFATDNIVWVIGLLVGMALGIYGAWNSHFMNELPATLLGLALLMFYLNFIRLAFSGKLK